MAEGLVETARRNWERWSLPGVSVLHYHGVYSDDNLPSNQDRKFWVSRTQLEEHLKIVRSLRLQTGLLRNCVEGNSNGHSLSDVMPDVIFTFDDGRR